MGSRELKAPGPRASSARRCHWSPRCFIRLRGRRPAPPFSSLDSSPKPPTPQTERWPTPLYRCGRRRPESEDCYCHLENGQGRTQGGDGIRGGCASKGPGPHGTGGWPRQLLLSCARLSSGCSLGFRCRCRSRRLHDLALKLAAFQRHALDDNLPGIVEEQAIFLEVPVRGPAAGPEGVSVNVAIREVKHFDGPLVAPPLACRRFQACACLVGSGHDIPFSIDRHRSPHSENFRC